MLLILEGPERWFCETETSSPVITYLCIYMNELFLTKNAVYCLLININFIIFIV